MLPKMTTTWPLKAFFQGHSCTSEGYDIDLSREEQLMLLKNNKSSYTDSPHNFTLEGTTKAWHTAGSCARPPRHHNPNANKPYAGPGHLWNPKTYKVLACSQDYNVFHQSQTSHHLMVSVGSDLRLSWEYLADWEAITLLQWDAYVCKHLILLLFSLPSPYTFETDFLTQKPVNLSNVYTGILFQMKNAFVKQIWLSPTVLCFFFPHQKPPGTDDWISLQ